MTEAWESEDIPDEDHIFLRVHRGVMRSRTVPEAGAFRNQPTRADGMSTNWDRYATATTTRTEARKPPEEYAVIRLYVSVIRQIPDQLVRHTPIVDRVNDIYNRAHTDVFGRKDSETRVLYLRAMESGAFENVIPLENEPK